MKARERILAVLNHEAPDIIPFTVYVETKYIIGLALYQPWRKLLDKGLGLHGSMVVQAHEVSCPNAKMEATHHYGNITSWSPVDILIAMNSSHLVTGSIVTPKGKLTLKTKWKSLDLSEMLPWFPEDGYLIKSSDDYEPLKYLIENTEYQPHYDDINDFKMIIGDYGVVAAFVPKSPFQALRMLMGPKTLALEYYTNRKEFEELYRLIYKKELEIYKIAAESPADYVWGPDNVTGQITTPTFFEKFSLPFYNEVAEIFHKHDKKYVVHMDGMLNSLKNLIPKTKIDAIESFTPPPMGDLPLKEARELWKDKIIWANFPESVSLQGQKAVKKTTLEMLKDVAPGDNFLMGVSEGFPSIMHTLASVPTILNVINKHGTYPIS
ncbi:MAG: uroporphyrinogen decarboxylase family protein [Promethearchaeota archaeon]